MRIAGPASRPSLRREGALAPPSAPLPTLGDGDGRCRWRLPLLLLATAALLAGCTALKPPEVVEATLHVFEPGMASVRATVARDLVLEIATPTAAPGFDTARMAYAVRPYELDYFAVNRWADAPARMLRPLLTRALERSGDFRAVVQSADGVAADLRLATEIVRLQQNFATRPSRVELVLRVQLVDVRNRLVVATRTIAETETAASDDPRGGVIAVNAALRRALAQVVEFCTVESGRLRPPSATVR
ncbi:MAG: membrane integrity-associated transporter subunit PqiC [Burkholderiales bacterium]|nr:membrane integrity-associated transporter subunit PqiC [Burkholderiales bacterium]